MKYAIDICRVICLVGFIALMMCLVGCSTPKVVTVTEYRERVQTDTLRKVDSVYVAHYVWQKGDTVRLTDTICQYRILRDVREVVVHDSIPYAVEVEREKVIKVVPKFYRFCTIAFLCLMAALIVFVALKIIKAVYLRR